MLQKPLHRYKPAAMAIAGIMTASILWGSPAGALTWKHKSGPFQRLDAAGIQFDMHPFGQDAFNASQGFRLYQGGYVPFEKAVASMLRDRVLSPLIQIKSESSSRGFLLVEGAQSHNFTFLVGGIPICDFAVKANATSGGESLILGTAPDVDVTSPIPSDDWPDVDATYTVAVESARDDLNLGGKAILADSSRCLRVVDGHLLPVWKLQLLFGSDPYEAIADTNTAYRVSPQFFDATGSAKVFPSNNNDKAMQTFDLPNLASDGTLTSTYLTTVMGDGSARAKNTALSFVYPATDAAFAEVSTYTHAQKHLEFFNSLGFSWYGPKPLQIHIHDQNNPNNAKFLAASKLTPFPQIVIGDADDVHLANLATDADVVSHELGHFIIYQTLKTTSGESLVLHEGLADFFTFSRTGNACLGESICPSGEGSACWSETLHTCLRTAEANVIYGSSLWDTLKTRHQGNLGHEHGQAISGLLWDMRKNNAVPASDVTKLGFAAISYLGDSSGFRDFLLSLFLADKELFASKYFDKIKAAAASRGFSEFITDVNKPSDGIPLPTGDSSLQSPASTLDTASTTKTTKSETNPFKCGTVGAGQSEFNGQALALVLMLMMPFLVARPGRRHKNVIASSGQVSRKSN